MDWVIIGLWGVAAIYVMAILGTILSIGKYRKPTTAGEAAVVVALQLTVLIIIVAAIWR